MGLKVCQLMLLNEKSFPSSFKVVNLADSTRLDKTLGFELELELKLKWAVIFAVTDF